MGSVRPEKQKTEVALSGNLQRGWLLNYAGAWWVGPGWQAYPIIPCTKGFIIPRACARGKVMWTQKSPNLEKWALDRLLYATKQSKVKKNYLMFASNRLRRPTSTTNRALSLATPIEHTYQCPMYVLVPLCMLDLKIGKDVES